jgi:hypothetical protein
VWRVWEGKGIGGCGFLRVAYHWRVLVERGKRVKITRRRGKLGLRTEIGGD